MVIPATYGTARLLDHGAQVTGSHILHLQMPDAMRFLPCGNLDQATAGRHVGRLRHLHIAQVQAIHLSLYDNIAHFLKSLLGHNFGTVQRQRTHLCARLHIDHPPRVAGLVAQVANGDRRVFAPDVKEEETGIVGFHRTQIDRVKDHVAEVSPGRAPWVHLNTKVPVFTNDVPDEYAIDAGAAGEQTDYVRGLVYLHAVDEHVGDRAIGNHIVGAAGVHPLPVLVASGAVVGVQRDEVIAGAALYVAQGEKLPGTIKVQAVLVLIQFAVLQQDADMLHLHALEIGDRHREGALVADDYIAENQPLNPVEVQAIHPVFRLLAAVEIESAALECDVAVHNFAGRGMDILQDGAVRPS